LALASGADVGSGAIGIYPSWEAVAAGYDGARPAGKSNLVVENYEGGCEINYPSTLQCTAIGISTTYGGSTGLIANLINGFKSSDLFKGAAIQQYNSFFASAHSGAGSWFLMTASLKAEQWSLYRGDVYSSPWQSLPAVTQFNQ
jgi:hypothetical protein